MPLYSGSDLDTHTARTLGVLGASETLSGEELEHISLFRSSEIAMLAALGLPIWNGSDLAIPLEYLNPLARRVALALEPGYGFSSVAEAQMAMREAERYLTIMAAPRGASPLLLRTDDAMPARGGFNFTTGL